ncbi:MAG: ABC transporter transmembrane domain-containing protein, partial [Halobacteriaceae archaeon]
MADGPSDIAGVYEASEDAPHPVWAILATYVPERPGLFAVGAVVAVVWRVAQLAPPYLIGVTLDTFLTSDQPGGLSLAVVPAAWVPATIRGQFLFVVGLFGGVVALMMVAHFVRFLVWRWFRQAVLHELRMDAYGAVQRLGMEFFVTERTGDVMSVLNNDINEFENFLGAWIRDVMQFAVFTGGLAVVMVLMHWQMAVVTFALLPVMLGLTFAYQRTIEPRYDERRSAVGALNARIE